MNQFAGESRASLLKKIPEMKWAHSFKVGGSVVTPGLWGAPNPLIVSALDDVDFLTLSNCRFVVSEAHQ